MYYCINNNSAMLHTCLLCYATSKCCFWDFFTKVMLANWEVWNLLERQNFWAYKLWKGSEISSKTHLLKISPSHYDNEFQYMTTNPCFIHSFAACVRNNFHMFSPNHRCLCQGRRASSHNMSLWWKRDNALLRWLIRKIQNCWKSQP